MRIASLLPSASEIALALGLDNELVGVTFECDVPEEIRDRVQILVGGRDTSRLTPAEIDAYVRDQVRLGADLYTLHADALAELAPEVILTQDLCHVCALSTDHVADALDHLGCDSTVVTLNPSSLTDVLDSIIDVADATGVPDRATGVVQVLRHRLASVAQTVAGGPRPRVAVVEWIDPVFGAGHWIPDLVAAAGGEPVACHLHQRSIATSWEAIAQTRPDIVVVAPCGFDLEGASAQALQILDRLPDVAVWAIDADGLVVRPGPRLVDGVEALAAIIHPDLAPSSPATRLIRA